MATAAQDDLSANFYLAGHTYIARSRILQKSGETTMGTQLTGFIQEMITETGNTTLSFISEIPFRGGKWVTIILT